MFRISNNVTKCFAIGAKWQTEMSRFSTAKCCPRASSRANNHPALEFALRIRTCKVCHHGASTRSRLSCHKLPVPADFTSPGDNTFEARLLADDQQVPSQSEA